MTTFEQFGKEISAIEGRLAHGSETSMYGHFVDRMSEIGGGRNWRESESEVPAGEVAWWRKAYEMYEADAGKPPSEQAQSVQEIFDAVSV